MTTLGDVLDAHTVEGELVRRLEDGAVECYACGHRCLIRPGRRGICQVRFNEGGTLRGARGVFEAARQAGMLCAYVSNGNATPEVLEYLRPWVTAYKIDLKTMRDRAYRSLGGVLDHVLETIRRTHELGFWVEVVPLVIPGFNDGTDELMDAARYLASISPEIPWHVTAFHPAYRMIDPPNHAAAAPLRGAG